jgi:hypothetical protein
MKIISSITAFLFISALGGFAQTPGQVKILFDCTKAETSGNADWVIDADVENLNWNPYASSGGSGYHSNPQQYPTPSQTTVTSSTAETYWEGSLSHWAIDCVNKGYWVETLGAFSLLTYGYSPNSQDLSNYNVFIVDEPNILFTAAQKTAMMNFVLNGGSLFMISDHTGSDRNNDGYDSPAIWNDFISNNGVQNNGFGFSVDLQNFSQTSSNVIASASDSLIHGPFGNVTQVKWTNGTSLTLNPSQNQSVQGVVYKTGSSGNTGVMCAYARLGCGKVVIIGDSSPPDDGTGNPHATLYNGYTLDAAGNHQRLLMNATIWLAQSNCITGINTISGESKIQVFPNPMTEELTIRLPVFAKNVSISFTDVLGKEVISVQTSGTEISIKENNLPSGLYLVKIIADEKVQMAKVIKR